VGLATRDPLHRRPLGQSAVIVLGGWFAVNSLTRIVFTRIGSRWGPASTPDSEADSSCQASLKGPKERFEHHPRCPG